MQTLKVAEFHNPKKQVQKDGNMCVMKLRAGKRMTFRKGEIPQYFILKKVLRRLWALLHLTQHIKPRASPTATENAGKSGNRAPRALLLKHKLCAIHFGYAKKNQDTLWNDRGHYIY